MGDKGNRNGSKGVVDWQGYGSGYYDLGQKVSFDSATSLIF
jgi:hypothetical protein